MRGVFEENPFMKNWRKEGEIGIEVYKIFFEILIKIQQTISYFRSRRALLETATANSNQLAQMR